MISSKDFRPLFFHPQDFAPKGTLLYSQQKIFSTILVLFACAGPLLLAVSMRRFIIDGNHTILILQSVLFLAIAMAVLIKSIPFPLRKFSLVTLLGSITLFLIIYTGMSLAPTIYLLLGSAIAGLLFNKKELIKIQIFLVTVTIFLSSAIMLKLIPDILPSSQLYTTWPVIVSTGLVVQLSITLIVYLAMKEILQQADIAHASEAHIRTIFNASLDAILVLSPDGIISDANPLASALFSLPEFSGDKLIGTKLQSLCTLYDPVTSQEIVLPPTSSSTRENNKTGPTDLARFYPHLTFRATTLLKGTTTPAVKELSISIAPIYQDTCLSGWVLTGKDITQDINQRIKYLQSQKMEVIGTLASGIAHDFNNVLSGVSGYSELIIEELQNTSAVHLEPVNTFAQEILSLSEQATRLVKQLQSFSRKELAYEFVNIHDIISQTIPLIHWKSRKRIEIILSLEARNPWITGNGALLLQAFLNIGINACDAMPDSGTLHISTRTTCCTQPPEVLPVLNQANECSISCLSAEKCILIEIEDTGHGMDQQTLSHIFEPFFTTKTREKGTGLGLSSTYSTITNHNGTISAASIPGKGTIFTIILPSADQEALQDKQEPVEAMQQNIDYLAGETSDENHRYTVLLADDDKSIGNATTHFLKSKGFSYYYAQNGVEAVDIFTKLHDHIDLVILDIHMPLLNGVEALYRIRAIKPEIPVIMITGYASDEDFERINTIDIGLKPKIVKKPFSLKELFLMVKQILDAQG